MNVQIPLWTIVTYYTDAGGRIQAGSDSSMDDCNLKASSGQDGVVRVQIPLWTIVTEGDVVKIKLHPRSDSSMDDCNTSCATPYLASLRFRFLYGRL